MIDLSLESTKISIERDGMLVVVDLRDGALDRMDLRAKRPAIAPTYDQMILLPDECVQAWAIAKVQDGEACVVGFGDGGWPIYEASHDEAEGEHEDVP